MSHLSGKRTQFLVFILVLLKVCNLIFTPLWLDALSPKDSSHSNVNFTTKNPENVSTMTQNKSDLLTTEPVFNVNVFENTTFDENSTIKDETNIVNSYTNNEENCPLHIFGKVLYHRLGPLLNLMYVAEETKLPATNLTKSVSLVRTIDPYFTVLSLNILMVCIFGLWIIFTQLICARCIPSRDRYLHPGSVIIPGFCQTLTLLLFGMVMSGTRTPPYLLALLCNFIIPIQFLTRLLILRKVPTLRKCICAAVVMLAEGTCLLPALFPGLLSKQQEQEDGGAPGFAKVLWALCYILAMVPGTVVNAVIERGVKERGALPAEGTAHHNTAGKRVNIAVYLFWFSFWQLLFTLLMFWIDIIPGFGTASNITIFFERIQFNFSCLLGYAGCSHDVVLIGWGSLLIGCFSPLIGVLILRYSEGANYLTVVMTLRSPIALLFWTLFTEDPFSWHPHTDITLWLGLSALAVMIPAIHLYSTGPEERTLGQRRRRHYVENSRDDFSPLLNENSGGFED